MDLGSILLALALTIAVVAFVVRPLFEHANKPDTAPTTSLDELAAQREAVLVELRDLDFEHSTGKLGAEDYNSQRYRLVTKGAEILRTLDAAQSAAPAVSTADDELEQLIAARRKSNARKASATSTAASASAACPNCGQAIEPHDKFCAHCGASLAAA